MNLSLGSLEQFRLADDLLNSIYVVPSYVSRIEQESLLTQINCAQAGWNEVWGRKVQSYGGLVTPKGLLPAKLPSWLQSLGARLTADTGVFGSGRQPNHVLVNAYEPGGGIVAHEDGPAYFPGVCILSLGGPAVLRFRRKTPAGAGDVAVSVVLMPRSLLVFKAKAYSSHLHGIDEVHEDLLDGTVANPGAAGLQHGDSLPRGETRVSLTVRRVERTLMRGMKL